MALPHVPTAAQLAQLAVYQAASTAASATLTSAQASLKAAQVAYTNAQSTTTQYASYIYGGPHPNGVISDGSRDNVF